MADNLAVTDAGGTGRAIATKEVSPNVHLYKQLVVDPAGTPLDLGALLATLTAAVEMLAPATDLIPITPSDTTLTGVRSLYIGTGGDLVVTINGHDRTLENVPDGFILSAQVTKVKAATTASGIIAYV